MVQAAPIYSSFNGGEWSPDLDGRVDNDFYASSCSSLVNFLCRVQGPATKRSGTRFVTRAKFKDKNARLIRFQFNDTQTYFLEFGDLYMRVFNGHAPITETAKTVTGVTQANPAVVTSNAHGFSNGNWVYLNNVGGMTQVNSKTFIVAGVTANTFTLQDLDGNAVNSTSYGAYTSGGTAARIYEVVTTYAEADLPSIRYCQSADVMFLACAGHIPQTLSRTGSTSWTFATYDFTDGPYLTQNATATTITPSATTGSVTLTASTSIFAADDVGRWVRVKQTGTWGAAQITAYTSGTVVTALVSTSFPFLDMTASKIYRLGLWKTGNWPQVVQFFQNRLFWFTGEQVDGTFSGDYYNFSPTLTDGTVTDSNGVQRPLGSNGVSYVQWAVSNEKAMVIGTRDGEWILKANTLGDAITQTNINATQATDFGSAAVQAFRVQGYAVLVQKTGRIVCQTGYDINVDGFSTIDLNLFNTSINEGIVKELAYVSHPDNHLFCAQQDGSMSVLTYNPSQSVKGWQRFQTDGTFMSVSSGAAPLGDREEAWFITERYINSQAVRFIEYLEDVFRYATLPEDGFFVDCGLTYDGRRKPTGALSITVSEDFTTAAVLSTGTPFVSGDVGKILGLFDGGQILITTYTDTTHVSGTVLRGITLQRYAQNKWWICDRVSSVSGLDHLEGKVVAVVGDGAVLVSRTVSGGAITLSSPSSVVHVGLPYTSSLTTNRINAGSKDGTSQGKIKRIHKVVLRVWRSLGGKYGSKESNFRDPITLRKPQDFMDKQLPLTTGDSDILEMPSDYGLDGQIVLVHDDPLPFTLVAIMPRVVTQDGS